MQKIISLAKVLLAGALPILFLSPVRAQSARPNDSVFRSAIAAWHMQNLQDGEGRSGLKAVGAATVGVALTGRERAESLAAGGDGVAANLDGGYFDAGQGEGGALNLSGSALTVAMRLRAPSGVWGQPLFSKHGGHDRLVYNLFSFPNALGFEMGIQGRPGMTQVSAPFARIGAKAWHTIVCCYDGHSLCMFVDGVLMDEADVEGALRTGNREPVLIGGESIGGSIKSGWRGMIDYAALWNRPLTNREIARLSGTPTQIARHEKEYKDMHTIPAPPDLYQEKYRPQFHFTARQWTQNSLNPGQREEGWLNDINGLIYLDGTYHMFLQRWARCWLHAVSTDLIHWTELAPAFWDDHRFGTGVQSGGAVYDRDNTSGLSHDPKHPPLIAFWSGFDNLSQCLSYSLDKGQTWTKYAQNPYMIKPERDPKVLWYAPAKKWIMVMSCQGRYDFLSSTNLLSWTQLPHSIPNSFECPDFFPLPLDGDPARQKWVLVRGNGKYSVGDFDGTTFVEETEQMPCDIGPNFYATMSWGDIAGAPGKRVQVAWMRGGKYPDMPFNQQVSFPCDMTLHTTPHGLRIYRNPVAEISKLHGKPKEWSNVALRVGAPLPLDMPGDLFHIKAEVEIPKGSAVTFHIHGATVVLTDSTVACNSKPAATASTIKTVEILVDRTSIETFVNGGETSLSACFLPTDSNLSISCPQGAATLRSLTVFPLSSIWKATPK